jgi:hypothetical protein
MSCAEFLEMHANLTAAMRAYVIEVEKTVAILAGCTEEPLTFSTRITLRNQLIIEQEAHLTYLGIRSGLFRVARSGYGSLS